MTYRRGRGPAGVGRALAAVLCAAIASLAAAGSATAITNVPLWQCRASAIWMSLADMNRTEPVLANGNPNTASNVSPDHAQCVNDETGGENQGSPFGAPPSFTTKTLGAKTTITPETGLAIDQAITSTAKVEDLHFQPDPNAPVQLGVGAAQADAMGSCVNGKPSYTGTSFVTKITLGGQEISLDQLLDQLSKALAPLGDIVEIKVNEQVPSADGLIVRALHVKVFRGAAPGPTPLVDLIVAEAKVGNNGEVCNAEKQFPFKVCPTGSVFDLTDNKCVIPATANTPRIVVGAAFAGPNCPIGGCQVIPLSEARKKYKSPCLSGPGPQYVIVGTNGRDRITGTNKADRILGRGGNDSLDGGRGEDCIDGGTGNDRVTGGIGSDRIYGMAGNDTVTGNLDNDRIYGGVGNDHLNGGPGADLLVGGAGHDTLAAGFGRDRALGGSGPDFINIAQQGPAASADCGSGRDKIRLNKKEVGRIHGCEIKYVLNDR